MDPIRIAYVIDQMKVGGTEGQLANLMNGLDRKRFEPYLITLRDGPKEMAVECENLVFPNRKMASLQGASTVLRISHALRRKRIQIVQTFFIDATFMGVVAAYLARVPVIISSRRDLGFWHTPEVLGKFRKLNHLVDRIIANSESVRAVVVEKENVLPDKIDVLYNGIDQSGFNGHWTADEVKCETGFSPDSPVVGIVSGLNREVKRIDIFLDAVPKILDKCPNTEFAIVGDGHLRDELESQCRSLGVAGRVKFLGQSSEVPRLISMFSIGVNCSDSEGFSNSVIEYMMAGIPVVASDVGGNRELVEEGADGLLFAPGEPSQLAEKIVSLLENPERAVGLGVSGRKKAHARFTAEAMITAHMDYYERLLSESARRRTLQKRAPRKLTRAQ